MNLIDRLFGRKNLTQDWTANPSVPLLVDLEAGTFCGVGPGMPVDKLRHLGPSANKRPWADGNSLAYPNQGFLLYLDSANQLETVDINILAEEGMAAFTGTWSFQGRSVAVQPATTPGQLQAILGTSDQRERTGSEALFYERPAANIWFEWGLGGSLENVTLDMPIK